MALESDINVIKRQIKDWEHSFVREHSKQPNKQDVKENSKISKLYKVYKALKNKQKQLQTTITPISKDLIDNIKGLSDEESEKDGAGLGLEVFLRHNTELGPTPQAGGKVLSIFDLAMTPPESSPLKDKQSRLTVFGDSGFKTPSKKKPLNQVTPIKSDKKSFMERINMIQNSSPISTPNRYAHISVQTPQYLNHNIKKFETSQAVSDVSPFNIPEQSSPLKQTPISTPTLTKINFQISPSPFKRKGFLGSKKLLDVFNEHKNIQIDEDEQDLVSDSSLDDEPIVEGQSPLKKRRAKTQKRTTRRWKMRPHLEEVESDDLQKKNIHKVMQEINEDHEKKIEKIINNQLDSEDEEPKEVPKLSKSTGKKVAPISHNYKRLKIHYKRGNNKWGRRR